MQHGTLMTVPFLVPQDASTRMNYKDRLLKPGGSDVVRKMRRTSLNFIV